MTACAIRNANKKLPTKTVHFTGVDLTVIGICGSNIRITMTRQYVCGNMIVEKKKIKIK